MGLAQCLSQLNALCHATEGCGNTDQVVDLLLDYHAINGESGSFTMSQDSQLKTRKACSKAKLEQRLRRIPYLGVHHLHAPPRLYRRMAEWTIRSCEELADVFGYLLADHPDGGRQPRGRGCHRSSLKHARSIQHPPELGIALDTPRVIFLLCLIALLLTFADYTAKVKRTRRARRR